MTQPDPNAQSGIDPNASGVGDQGGEGSNGEGNDSGTQSGAAAASAPAGRVYTAEEYESLQNRMRAADQNRARFEAELAQLKNKDLPEAERLKADLAAAEERATQLEQKAKNTLIHNAFLQDNTYDWHNPTRALGMLDMDKVDIDLDSGAVTGLKHAIDALAKSDPYLIKPKADDGDGAGAAAKGGTIPANNGNAGSGKPSREKLGSRFSAMRTR